MRGSYNLTLSVNTEGDLLSSLPLYLLCKYLHDSIFTFPVISLGAFFWILYLNTVSESVLPPGFCYLKTCQSFTLSLYYSFRNCLSPPAVSYSLIFINETAPVQQCESLPMEIQKCWYKEQI